MSRAFFLNRLRWPIRLPVKWALLGLTGLAVCFPYPSVLLRHIEHWRDPNALIEPEAEALEPLIVELRARLTADLSARETLNTVERFVYEKLPYAWDWETWGTADYLPTVAEAMEKGREDCDGRAVIAASLLQRLGYETQIVTDFAHVWVKTDQGETMGPGKTKAVVATSEGLEIHFEALAGIPRAMAYGVAVFPLVREAIVLVAFWLLMLRSGGGGVCSLTALVFLAAGLLILRRGGADHRNPIYWLQIVGVINLIAGVVALTVWASGNARIVQHATQK